MKNAFLKKTAILYIIKHDTQILIIFFWQRELLVCKLKKGKENSDKKKKDSLKFVAWILLLLMILLAKYL